MYICIYIYNKGYMGIMFLDSLLRTSKFRDCMSREFKVSVALHIELLKYAPTRIIQLAGPFFSFRPVLKRGSSANLCNCPVGSFRLTARRLPELRQRSPNTLHVLWPHAKIRNSCRCSYIVFFPTATGGTSQQAQVTKPRQP